MSNPENVFKSTGGESVAALLAAGAQQGKCQPPFDDHGKPYVLVPPNYTVHEFQRSAQPLRHRGIAQFGDLESMLLYVVSLGFMPAQGARFYAQLEPAELLVILNDHPNTPASIALTENGALVTPIPTAKPDGVPGWGDFGARYAPQFSRQWNTWMGHNGKDRAFSDTEELALFIENNLPDFINPAGADMLQMALNFRVNSNVVWSAARVLQDGAAQLNFNRVVQGSAGSGGEGSPGSVQIPGTFTLNIPVFETLRTRKFYQLEVRFRYRLRESENRLSLWYEIIRPWEQVELAFTDLLTHAEAVLGHPALYRPKSK